MSGNRLVRCSFRRRGRRPVRPLRSETAGPRPNPSCRPRRELDKQPRARRASRVVRGNQCVDGCLFWRDSSVASKVRVRIPSAPGFRRSSRPAGGTVCVRHYVEPSEADSYRRAHERCGGAPCLRSMDCVLAPWLWHKMLRPECNSSAIVIRSDSERKRAEMTTGLRCETGAYFLMSPDFTTTVWPCRQRLPELRLVPRSGTLQSHPFPVSSADHSEPV